MLPLWTRPARYERAYKIAATVYVIELMYERWEKLTATLVHTANDPKESIVLISLKVLSRICDLLANFGHSIDRQKMGNDTECILGSLLISIDEKASGEVRKTALKALRTAAEFVSECVERQDARIFVLRVLLINLSIKEEETVVLTYQLMIELVKALYVYLDEPYVKQVIALSKQHLQSNSQNVVIIACEYWSTFAVEETYRKENLEVD
jgi:hypothetical protein